MCVCWRGLRPHHNGREGLLWSFVRLSFLPTDQARDWWVRSTGWLPVQPVVAARCINGLKPRLTCPHRLRTRPSTLHRHTHTTTHHPPYPWRPTGGGPSAGRTGGLPRQRSMRDRNRTPPRAQSCRQFPSPPPSRRYHPLSARLVSCACPGRERCLIRLRLVSCVRPGRERRLITQPPPKLFDPATPKPTTRRAPA